MNIFKSVRFLSIMVLSAVALLLGACGGGGGGNDYPTPVIPANAVTFTQTNASTYASDGVSNIEEAEELRSAQTGYSLQDVTNLINDQLAEIQASSVATGATQSETYPCESGEMVITVDGDESSYTGSLTYSNCVFFTITMNGKIDFEGTGNSNTGAFTSEGGGTLTIADSTDSTSITMVMYFDNSGNIDSGAFTNYFSMSVAGTGLPEGGYLMTTVTPLKGTGFNIESGEIRLYGANGTQVRILVIDTDLAEVSVNENDGNGFVVVDSGFFL